MADDWLFPDHDAPTARAHFLRRVQTGISDGFDLGDPSPDMMIRMVWLSLFPASLPDESACHTVMSPDQADSLADALTAAADRARQPM